MLPANTALKKQLQISYEAKAEEANEANTTAQQYAHDGFCNVCGAYSHKSDMCTADCDKSTCAGLYKYPKHGPGCPRDPKNQKRPSDAPPATLINTRDRVQYGGTISTASMSISLAAAALCLAIVGERGTSNGTAVGTRCDRNKLHLQCLAGRCLSSNQGFRSLSFQVVKTSPQCFILTHQHCKFN